MLRLAHKHLQSGVLPYRVGADGNVRVLLISTGKPGRWCIPKGAVEPHLSFGENAAHEALEEAGIAGQVAQHSIGKYRSTKRVRDHKILVEVWVYLMQVDQEFDEWPEMNTRQRVWVSAKEAARIVKEPFLARLCTKLGRSEIAAADFWAAP